jgi:predicted metallopeptidase
MVIRYCPATDVKILLEEIANNLGFSHVPVDQVLCLRSRGSKATHTIARIHGLSRVWQRALGVKAHYVVEVISEKYDSLTQEGKEKVVIHELLHVPKSFQGGFRHHKGWITSKRVTELHQALTTRRMQNNEASREKTI